MKFNFTTSASHKMRKLQISLLGALVMAGLGACSWDGPSGSQVAQGKKALEARLREPGSVKYGKTWLGEWMGIKATCGRFSARNAFGGHTPMRRFLVVGGRASVQSDDPDQFRTDWYTYCEPLQSP